MKLWHVTTEEAWAAIRAGEGLRGPSYWASDEDMSAYYVETVEDEGGTPVILEIELEDLDPALLEPDMPSIHEPIMTVLRARNGWSRGFDESGLWARWQGTGMDWRASLDLVGTVRYRGVVPAVLLSEAEKPAPGR